MGWFDEQIRQRKLSDEELFQQSFVELTNAIKGKRIIRAFQQFNPSAFNALYDIINALGGKVREIPANITNLEEQIDFVSHPNGIMHRKIKLKSGWSSNSFGEILATFKSDGSPVALIQNLNGGYYYVDENGHKHNISTKNEALFDSEAILFYKPFPQRPLTTRELLKFAFMARSIKDTIFSVLIMLIITLLGTLLPKLTNFFYTEVISEKSVGLLVSTAVFYLALIISQNLLALIRELSAPSRSDRMKITVEAATMMRILNMPTSFFKDMSSGEIAHRASYVPLLTTTLLNSTVDAANTSLFSLIYITQIYRYAPALAVPAIFIILGTLVITLVNIFFQQQVMKTKMYMHSIENGKTLAYINGIQKIKLAGAEKRAFFRWSKAYADYVGKTPLFNIISNVLIIALTLIGTIVMYYMAIKSHVSGADYMAFNTAYGMVMGAFTSLTGLFNSLSLVRPMIETIKPILETSPEVTQSKINVNRLSGSIEINNLTFKYNPSSPEVISDLSLKIRPGEYIAVVGKTGCGKSTLVRLLLGFERADKGGIYYDGHEIDQLDQHSLRRRIGVVTQGDKLFNADIYSNITITAPWLSVEEAWEAARIAQVDEDIKAMPMGMQTLLSEGGAGISGGQRQRLMIARALAPGPNILIFDEATSALDNLTQRKVSEALDAIKCTRIIIAHRLSTIKHCDRILVLDSGKIIEEGTYDELLSKHGAFAELIDRQRIDKE